MQDSLALIETGHQEELAIARFRKDGYDTGDEVDLVVVKRLTI
jgi:hypothetical protein